MTPGQLKLLEDMKDAKDFYANHKEEVKIHEGEGHNQESPNQKSNSKIKKKKTSKEKKKEEEEQEAEYKKELEQQLIELWESSKDRDPYKDFNMDKCDGKIQIDEENREKGPSEASTIPVKYRYFIKKR